MTRTDHRGNVLGDASCSLCRSCWVYVKMADWRENGLLGLCIYGGPYSGFVQGYRPGEVEAARRKAYGS